MLKFARPRKVARHGRLVPEGWARKAGSAGPAALPKDAAEGAKGRWPQRHLGPETMAAGLGVLCPQILAWRRRARLGRGAGRGGFELRVGAQMFDDGLGRPAVDLEVARLLVDPDQGASVHAGFAVDLGHVVA